MRLDSAQPMLRLSILLSAISLSACGPFSSDSGNSSSSGSPAASARTAPETKYDLANGCYRLQAQGSKAQILGLANAGGDTVNAIKAVRTGVIQSSWTTRTAPGKASAHRLCQWPGPESRQPGTMTMGG